MSSFVDEVECRVHAGDGGHGVIAFLREKFRPNGGPCGGDGGSGGSVIFVVDHGLRTLLDFRNRPVFQGERGQHGQGSNKTGKSGKDLLVKVPPGTEVSDLETREFLGDLTTHGQQLVVAQGGRGGRGNQHFATARQKAPHRATDGQPGESRRLKLTLKLMADVGLVGFPNAGKSTLLSAVSRARPKVAEYPFTTLEPMLGLVEVGDYQSLVLADIPGLIEGAHTGKGLGLQFLRHIERTRVLLFLVDITDPHPDESLARLQEELRAHSEDLAKKPWRIALSKADLLPEGELPDTLSRLSQKPYIISSHSGAGIRPLISDLYALVTELDRPAPSESEGES